MKCKCGCKMRIVKSYYRGDRMRRTFVCDKCFARVERASRG